MRPIAFALLFFFPTVVHALDANIVRELQNTSIALIGEIHDNPAHHENQERMLQAMKPAAIVFEMLTELQAAKVVPGLVNDFEALKTALDWHNSGWPDFSLYYPLFASAPKARVYGAQVPREQLNGVVMSDGPIDFGPETKRFGLDTPLPEEQLFSRLALQRSAHCDALPETMLPGMVRAQRLRDASLAREVLKALTETGGPVAVITGNGHARRDWGVPAMLGAADPELDIFVVGQTEDDMPLDGGFDVVISAPAQPREDPCKAFQ